MGYRKLLARYMSHVNRRSGDSWLRNERSTHLSDRDVNELRAIWAAINRDAETAELGNFNQRAAAIATAFELNNNSLAKMLGWKQAIVSQWFLPESDPNFRKMTRRDFEHFRNSLEIDEDASVFIPTKTLDADNAIPDT